MRMLFCFVGGPGHFEPMVPIARTTQTKAHTVAVACGPSQVPTVDAAGFSAYAIGPPAPPGAVASAEAPVSAQRLPLRAADMAREDRDLRDRFADQAARLRAEGVRNLARYWAPDVIVADEFDFGSMIAAEVLGVPHATVMVNAAGSLIRPEVVGVTLDKVRQEHGLAPDPGLGASSRYLALSPFPPGLRDPAFPLPPTAHGFRTIHVADATTRPPWPRHLEGKPTVYFTLGTEFNIKSGDLFIRVVTGLAELEVNVLVTVGHQIDPAELGSQPAHVHIERYLPQADVLPHCDLAVFHGGSGTLTGVLAHGLPMVLLAMGADQPGNAARCEALGVGLSLDPVGVTPGVVREAVRSVLAEPAYRRAAQCLQAEMAALPHPGTAVAMLERLAVERQPLPWPG